MINLKYFNNLLEELYEDFDISKVIGQIYTRINLFKSVQIQDLLERHESQPAPATELIPHRKCDKCGIVKVLNNDKDNDKVQV